jgi:hypothetical protein
VSPRSEVVTGVLSFQAQFDAFLSAAVSVGNRISCSSLCLFEAWSLRNRINKSLLLLSIDYKREDGRNSVSVSCVAISNPDSLSSIDNWINPGIKT